MAKIVVLQEISSNMKRVQTSLEPVGHTVVGFSSQAEAIDYLRKERVDLIISAVHLINGNVFDFLKWSKSYPTNQATPFIFFCAEPTEFAKHVSGGVKCAGELLGASKYIMMDKFDVIQFRSEIARLLLDDSPPASVWQQHMPQEVRRQTQDQREEEWNERERLQCEQTLLPRKRDRRGSENFN